MPTQREANPPAFTDDQRGRLKKLGLFDEQVEALESRLIISQLMLAKLPKRNDVKDKLDNLLKALRKSQQQISKFLAGVSEWETEAIRRVLMADFDFHSDEDKTTEGDTIAKALGATDSAVEVVRRAVKDMRKQSRDRAADIRPIREIEKALLNGFLKHHKPNALPPYLLRTSLSKEPFPSIAAIFYEALGYKDKNLERPIRSYLEFRRRRETEDRQARGIPVKKSPRHKSGQQAKKKPNLLS